MMKRELHQEKCGLPLTIYQNKVYKIQVSQLRELIEVKEVITPYGRSGS